MKTALAFITTLLVSYACLGLTADHPAYLIVIAVAVMGAFIISSIEKLTQTIERLIQAVKEANTK